MHCGIIHGNCEKHSKNEQNYRKMKNISLKIFVRRNISKIQFILYINLQALFQVLHVDWSSEHSFECVRTYFWKILNKFFFSFFQSNFDFWNYKFSSVWVRQFDEKVLLHCKIFSSSAMSMKKISHVAYT